MNRLTCTHLVTYGVAPCGATFGTAAGPNDGVTPCAVCGVIHPVQWVCAWCKSHLGFVLTPPENAERPDA